MKVYFEKFKKKSRFFFYVQWFSVLTWCCSEKYLKTSGCGRDDGSCKSDVGVK